MAPMDLSGFGVILPLPKWQQSLSCICSMVIPRGEGFDGFEWVRSDPLASKVARVSLVLMLYSGIFSPSPAGVQRPLMNLNGSGVSPLETRVYSRKYRLCSAALNNRHLPPHGVECLDIFERRICALHGGDCSFVGVSGRRRWLVRARVAACAVASLHSISFKNFHARADFKLHIGVKSPCLLGHKNRGRKE